MGQPNQEDAGAALGYGCCIVVFVLILAVLAGGDILTKDLSWVPGLFVAGLFAAGLWLAWVVIFE